MQYLRKYYLYSSRMLEKYYFFIICPTVTFFVLSVPFYTFTLVKQNFYNVILKDIKT